MWERRCECSVGMWLKLSCYQLKTDCHKYILRTLHGNHKGNFSNRYIIHGKKRIKAYQYKKSTNHKGRQQERKKGTKKLQNRKHQSDKYKPLPIYNYFQSKLIK